MISDELRKLREITEKCMEQATIAQQNAARYIEYYRVQVEKLERQAAHTTSPEAKSRILRVAASHERLIKLAESGMGSAEIASDAFEGYVLPVRDAEEHQEQEGARPAATEDPITQARRHVAEAEQHIARQEALVIRLSNNDRYAALVGVAREVLATLKQTLSLARQHLELEQKK